MTKNEIKTANRALYMAARGTSAQVDAFEATQGQALSSILDAAWDAAETAGNRELARRLQAAYNRLTAW